MAIRECNIELFWFLHIFPLVLFFTYLYFSGFLSGKKLCISKIIFTYLLCLFFLLSFPVSFLFNSLHYFYSSFSPLFPLVSFLQLVFSLWLLLNFFFISCLALFYPYNSFINFAHYISSSLFVSPLYFWDFAFLLWASVSQDRTGVGREGVGEWGEGRDQDIFFNLSNFIA